MYDKPLIIISIYAPTRDKYRKQSVFFEYLKNQLDNYSDQNIILGGDFNICLDLNVDKIGGLTEKESLYAKNFKLFMKETDLVDIWCIRNPNETSLVEKTDQELVSYTVD